MAGGPARADNRAAEASRNRVVLADDDVLLRQGLANLLDPACAEAVQRVEARGRTSY